MLNGTLSTKSNILANHNDMLEDKVYTKKININKEFIPNNDVTNTLDIISVSLSSDNPSMNNTRFSKVRINTKNRNNSWVNIFVTEADDKLIDFINDKLNIK